MQYLYLHFQMLASIVIQPMDVPAPMQIALMALVSAGQDTSKLEPSVKQVNCFMHISNVVRHYNNSDHVSVTAYYIETRLHINILYV